MTCYTATNALGRAGPSCPQMKTATLKSRQRDPLPVPKGYEEILQPDFFAETDQLCFAIMEVKKPRMAKEDVEADNRKLPCMMKLALDMLIHANVQEAAVIGFLVNGGVCEVLSMTLQHEAIYIPQSLGKFKLPHDGLDLASLLLALAC
ncbi:hypothetical protein BGZ70_001203 [Mortierella alpina]|uniref:Uncharacterized protein n=1 Tax=Mortierella alpina TaxID=64518 RepID=A0A9P6IWD4_MORAP|nr:hypothetical protein BGZ70_001203 [Mortierella alpina]